MKIALIQSDLVWENPIANRVHFEEKINAVTEKIDLIQPLEEIDYILPTNVVIDTIPGDPDNPRPKG